ncbi:MAG: hypothetical protein QOF92_4958 [Pseudonocardiales bacterium]|nr:hypothetical protein [Pseudonocardiales bacterium]
MGEDLLLADDEPRQPWIESAGNARARMSCLRAAIGTDAGVALWQGLHPLLKHVWMG